METLINTAPIPAIRVPPQLRQTAEAQAEAGKGHSSFVEDPVWRNVAYRRTQRKFVARGAAAVIRL